MRRLFATLAIASLAAYAGWLNGRFSRMPAANETSTSVSTLKSHVEFDVKLARISFLEPVFVAERVVTFPKGFGDRTVSRIEFEGKTFWLVDLHRGFGVPYKSIGLYAPTGEGEHSLCLEAESCGAGHVKPELDATTGVLQLREFARSNLEGQVILSCNLRSVGTYQSVHGK